MPLNIPGLLVPFQLLINPRIVLPSIIIKDIRHLDFAALHKAGYRGVVFDKDNCLTKPHKDTIVPEIKEAWEECRKTFGEKNILIVSNSAGTRLDSGGIKSEAVTYNTGAPVLRHESLKPAYSCISAIRSYFSSLQFSLRDEELIVVGDRVFTDIVMANRMRQGRFGWKSANRNGGTAERQRVSAHDLGGPLAILTTNIWEREAPVMRWFERRIVDIVHHWTNANGEQGKTQFVKNVILPVE